MMKLQKIALYGIAALLAGCGGNEAKVCGSDDVKDQLVKVFTAGPLAGHTSVLNQSELKNVAIIEKDADSGVLECVGTLSVPLDKKRVIEGILQYRIAPVALSDYDYLLLLADGERSAALADRLARALKNTAPSQ